MVTMWKVEQGKESLMADSGQCIYCSPGFEVREVGLLHQHQVFNLTTNSLRHPVKGLQEEVDKGDLVRMKMKQQHHSE